MAREIVQVDAFTSRPFAGNPAAVCLLEEPPPDWWLQDVAREMNLSETAFLIPHADGFDLRWFTPTAEVDLCGHATLASAHVLWEEERLGENEVARFFTRSGLLTARKADDWIEMDFPALEHQSITPPDRLSAAIKAQAVWVGKSGPNLLVQLADEKMVRSLRPDMAEIAAMDVQGIIVTSEAISEGFDFVSRYFAPRMGIPEDPVTGSAHCSLGPFWAERLGRRELVGYQVSSRGGTVRVKVENGGVVLGGQAVTVVRGTLFA